MLFFTNLFTFLYLLTITPKLLYDWLVRGKQHPGLLQRLGIDVPHLKQPVIWMHAISVGEVKGLRSFFLEMRKLFPTYSFLITTCTKTGQEEAKRSLTAADAIAYFPIDFSWIVKRWVRKINPAMFLLMETDFWPQLLHTLKKQGTKIALVSGKISAKSAKRLSFFKPFAKKLFSPFDLLCVQNEEYASRFSPYTNQIRITGNLKCDTIPEPIDKTYWQNKLCLPEKVIAISCTHAPEEELLLDALCPLDVFIILAPRHPERFSSVAKILEKKKISFSLFTEGKAQGKVLLVNTMGVLPICYTFAKVSIMGGSFVEGIGGHNILEPCQHGSPVFFGPHMHMQKDLIAKAIALKAGQMCTLANIADKITSVFAEPQEHARMARNTRPFCEACSGTALKEAILCMSALIEYHRKTKKEKTKW